MITRAPRSSIMGSLMSSVGLKEAPDSTKDLESHRIKKDNRDIDNIIQQINGNRNPFLKTADTHLYALNTGKGASSELEEELVNCVAIGERWCDEFKEVCLSDEVRFEKR